jgi:O-antigen chain-terminating methyltransferase
MSSESQVFPLNRDRLIEQINQSAAFYKSAPRERENAPKVEAPPAPPVNLSGMKEWLGYTEGFLQTARDRAEVRSKWPDSLNRFPFILLKPLEVVFFKLLTVLFKDQREVNLNLIEVCQQSLKLNEELTEQLAALHTQVHALNWRGEEMQKIWSSADGRLQQVEYGLSGIQAKVESGERRLDGSERRLDGSERRLDDSERRLDGSEGRLDRQQVAFVNFFENFKAIDRRNFQDINYLKNDLIQQKRLLANFLEEIKRSLPEPLAPEKLQDFVREEGHFLDAFYVAFEDAFRGSREEIWEKLQVYLPLIEKAGAGSAEAPILDVGCGRGEWLELLREKHYAAKGLDLNQIMVGECRDRRLDVTEADAIAYLQSLPDGSLGAVTGFHIIEHLPFQALIALFDEALRVLRSGGLIIFETPNPANVLVGSCNFYFDPTHRNPLPGGLVKFIAQFRGFDRVEILPLHPCPESLRIDGSELAGRFSDYFYGPQDYAVIGYKI